MHNPPAHPPPRARSSSAPPTHAARAFNLLFRFSALAALLTAATHLDPALAWPADLCAMLAAQWAILWTLAAAVSLLLRRRVPALILALAAALHLAAVVAAPRAERSLATPAPSDQRVRLLVYNAHNNNPTPDAALDLILTSDADIVALAEPTDALLNLIRTSPDLHQRYPHFWLPDRARVGFKVVLTRWPQLAGPALTPSPSYALKPHGVHAMLLRTPAPNAEFAFIFIHPDSPRNPAEWAKGNAALRHTLQHDAAPMMARGTPVVLAGDLNATPTGSRSRLLAAAGLRRCKSRFLPVGTYPATSPWPLSIAIDDAAVSPSVRVASWRRLGRAGSDHAAILVELDIPLTQPSP